MSCSFAQGEESLWHFVTKYFVEQVIFAHPRRALGPKTVSTQLNWLDARLKNQNPCMGYLEQHDQKF